MKKTVLIPIPEFEFDPTEVAIPWERLTSAGHKVIFATPTGKIQGADPRMLTGDDLGVFKLLLMAHKSGVQAYKRLSSDPHFKSPKKYEELKISDFDGLVLPGGHAPGMKPYLESNVLHNFIGGFFESGKPVGAICHGVVVAARSQKPSTGKSVLWGRKTTGLTKSMELSAWFVTKAKLGDYYRTYPVTVEDEVRAVLKDPSDFLLGPLPVLRDTFEHLSRGYTVVDGHYVSARWPGDAHRFSVEFQKLLEEVR